MHMLYALCYITAVSVVNLDMVSADLYVTNPLYRAIYSAGHSTTISWVDDGFKPHLKDMGSLKIDLYTGDKIYLTTLATGVNPSARSQNVSMPPEYACETTNFMMCFTSTKPPSTTFTANFMIQNTASTSMLPQTTNKPGIGQHLLTLALPNTTDTSRLFPIISPVATSPYGGNDDSGYKHWNGAGLCKRIHLEKIKFRLVFILWPALIGVTMAL